MILSIDIGGTNTHGVLMDDGKVKSAHTVEGKEPGDVRDCFGILSKKAGNEGFGLVLTGGGARKMQPADFPVPFRAIDEIEAIGAGGELLSGRKDIFVVSIGTGTAFVSVRGGRCEHVGGTGVGGGTIHGLSGLMLGLDPDGAEEAARGAGGNLDITVGDIVGGSLGRIPSHATASNFGRARRGSGGPEAASSLLTMIAESIGVMAFFAAKTRGQEGSILICGRVAINKIIKEKIVYTIGMFGGKASIPKDAEFCAAMGAAVLGSKGRG